MFMMAPAELVFLMLAGTGNMPHDVVSVIDADDYFRSRQIAVKVADLVPLAEKEPKDGKAQIAQLLALRWLGEHPDQVKKDAKAREALEQIAAGKKGQDPVGFAREYAQEALALVEGKPAPKPTPLPEDSVRGDALKWFPNDAAFFGAIDLRPAGEVKSTKGKPLFSRLLKIIPPREREEMYKFVDGVGNIRLDRVSFAYSPNPAERQKGRIYIRYTGLADRKGLAEFIKSNLRDSNLEYRKGPKGEVITVIHSPKNPPAFAFIGDTDLIMAGYDGNADAIEVVDDALDVRAGKKPSLVTGPFADKLKKVPALASGLIMGDLPEDIRRDLTRSDSPFKAAPRSFDVYMTRDKELDIHFHATMADQADAKAFAESVDQLKKTAVAGLKALPPQIKIKPESLDLLTKTLEAIKAEPKDSSVTGGVQIPDKVFAVLEDLMEMSMGIFMGEKAPKPPATAVPQAAPPAR